MLIPPRPRPGDRVAVLSPAAALPAILPAPFDLGLQRMADELGLVPVEYATTRKWGSSPAERAADVHAAFADPTIAAVMTSIGGNDQIKVLPHLDADLIRANLKPFYGLSDNTNLCAYLSNLGIVSYYGGTVMTVLGRYGSTNPHSMEALRAALFDGGWYELRPAERWTDMGKDWADPANLLEEPEMFPGTGWQWHGGADTVEGDLWGGCLEIVDWNLRAARWLRPDHEYDGHVLFLETSEEMPSASYVYEVLMCLGERGLLQRFSALLMGRPKGWELEHQTTPQERTAYVEAQHESVLRAMREYSPDVPVVLDVDLGHTDPQLVVPYGGRCRIDPGARTVAVHY
ncbi:S66 peptidase family protein [Luteipulveratus flavus]|uniref:LD-carboxypeptidase n=1 Tax=Luteipulveratus flavus TaxID=3031728 RepID=A0ABT6C8Z0_9MICO|nr:S66 peptidase family protein [Luteipulveratus sp. YIM 133296]MDF8265387.1 LD-carboxypeptidase [Luteipulveratus sp. YIM 133296]